jgi:DNA-binding transcriptional regulator WhiA
MTYPVEISRFKDSDKKWKIRIVNSNRRPFFTQTDIIWENTPENRNIAKRLARAINTAYNAGIAHMEYENDMQERENCGYWGDL